MLGTCKISKNNIFLEELRASASTLNNHEKPYNNKEKKIDKDIKSKSVKVEWQQSVSVETK